MTSVIDLVLHIDTHLLTFVATYGIWVYALLFAIIFAETGLVVMPFLPGDSLLFAAGALCGAGAMSGPKTFGLLALAAFAGNAMNYAIGRAIGPRIFQAHDRSGWIHRLLNHDHLSQAHAFFERYGGRAVVLSRFVPILRTVVPFVAGAGTMAPHTFLLYNVVGAIGWVGLCLGAGMLFGNVTMVKEHFSLVTLGIVFVSVLPMAIEYLRHRTARTP